MQGNDTSMPLLTVQENLVGLYIGCPLKHLSDTRNADRYSTTVTLRIKIRGSTAPKVTLQLEVIKIKKYNVQKVSVCTELKFPVCSQFVFGEDVTLLPAKPCKHFLPKQNMFS